ncbi:hypothetical protein MMC14_000624 [Varicellaria rhodocarpa]|nr:hypothetical protein [Varicellaria rhodocarpa]
MTTIDSRTRTVPLRASYASPKDTHQFELQLPRLSQQVSTQEKTDYLSSLRSAVVNLQDEVNQFLTAKMQGDNMLALNESGKVDDKTEEENYGEEVVEED